MDDSNLDSLRNVADLLTQTAANSPELIAVAHDTGRSVSTGGDSMLRYDTITFGELDKQSDRIALGLQQMGAKPGTRLALLVPPSVDFIALVYGMFKSGATIILIDPGMGKKNMIRCLSESRPEGFVAIPMAHAVRVLLRKRFPLAKLNVTAGRRWFWGGKKLSQFEQLDEAGFSGPPTSVDDPAAIIFTTGSTGPSKGVLYHHRNFIRQAQRIGEHYSIEAGGADLSAFPLFALFNAALGKTTVIPDMDATRPADADPEKIIRAIRDWNIDQSFGSPALWNTVSRYCEKNSVNLPTLKRILSAGAPVPVHVLKRLKPMIAEDGDIFTPYGATEALPVASISATEILNETSQRTAEGAGTCIGRRFAGIQWRVIRITDEPLANISDTQEVPRGTIGELMVQGEVVTARYVTRVDANDLHKVSDGETFWHRMGDVGWLDEDDRFWFCGRKTHRLQTTSGTMYTIPCEAIINNHKSIYRSAVVGIGEPGKQRAAIIAEPWPEEYPAGENAETRLIKELKSLASENELTEQIELFFVRRSLPVDIRHNAKIFREKLAVWAANALDKM